MLCHVRNAQRPRQFHQNPGFATHLLLTLALEEEGPKFKIISGYRVSSRPTRASRKPELRGSLSPKGKINMQKQQPPSWPVLVLYPSTGRLPVDSYTRLHLLSSRCHTISPEMSELSWQCSKAVSPAREVDTQNWSCILPWDTAHAEHMTWRRETGRSSQKFKGDGNWVTIWKRKERRKNKSHPCLCQPHFPFLLPPWVVAGYRFFVCFLLNVVWWIRTSWSTLVLNHRENRREFPHSMKGPEGYPGLLRPCN